LAGDWRVAGPLVARVTEPSLLARASATRADAAVLQGPRGLANLPPELRANTERVLQSLESIARGEDRVAADAVANIQTDSPFFEWRVLVDGLVAFYSGGSPSESWQALSPDRAPSAIAAPFRASQDRAFLDGLAAWQQAELKSVITRFNTSTWLAALEDAQRLAAQDDLGAAVRRAGDVIRSLPHSDGAAIRSRLPRVMYWSIARSGENQHFESYRRKLGPPMDDPRGNRFHAIQAEHDGDDSEAQGSWAEYERDLADGGIVPESHRDLARSLISLRIGRIAERCCPPSRLPPRSELNEDASDDVWDDETADDETADDASEDDEFEGDYNDESDARFPAIECYRRSVELDPRNRIAHERLIDLLEMRGDRKQVVAEARRMIETFPEHERSLSALAKDAATRECWDEAAAFQERAVRARPHDPDLTEQLVFYRFNLTCRLAQQGRFDDARALLDALLRKECGHDRYGILCRQAAVEILAGQTDRGDRLFDEACQAAPSRLAAVYRMLIDSIRMPLDYGRTMRLESDFRQLIQSKPDAATVRELITTVSAFRQTGTSYDGLLDHEPLILGLVKRAKRLQYSHEHLLTVCRALNAFRAEKLTLEFAKLGIKQFPDDPHFPFFAGMYYYAVGPADCPMGTMIRYLSDVEKLAHGHAEHAELAESAAIILRSIQAYSRLRQLTQVAKAIGSDAPMPKYLANEIERVLGVSLHDFANNDSDDDWPDDEREPRRRRR